MRRGEILGLKWDQVRNGFIYLDKTKTNEPRQIPLNTTMEALFRDIRRDQQLGSVYVFGYNEQELKSVKTAFNSAVKRAGIVDFRFHDLRHTFASHMVMSGASLKDVQEILGHKTLSMTLRYAHLAEAHKKQAVNLIGNLTPAGSGATVTKVAQNEKRG
jgi:integrase